jgi:superfamily II DNA or RNA helicase/HKD family nuclease
VTDLPIVEALKLVRPIYEIPDDDLVGDVLIPALAVADAVDIAVGFFTSQCLAQIAPGLAGLIDRGVRCRLLISPEISEDDRAAIERGLTTPEEALDDFMVNLISRADADPISAHAADCLSYLVAAGTFDIRCVLMERGMFHKKSWTISSNELRVGIHGSGNLTARGLLVNGEQMTIDRPWMDGPAAEQRVDQLANSFQEQWENRKTGRLTITPRQLVELLKERPTAEAPPTTSDFWSAWTAARNAGLAPELPPGVTHSPGAKRLSIPTWLDWQHPPYEHQAAAVAALESRDLTGIVAMATGGGKTKTALIAVARLQERTKQALLVVILVPTKTLAFQWSDEVRGFGGDPYVLTGPTPAQRRRIYEEVELSLRLGEPRTEVLIAVTLDDDLRAVIASADNFAQTILIADEAHNYGAEGFIANPPVGFQHKIALSATPVRQYDHEGTRQLFDFFETSDEPAYSFSLHDAIRVGCLTPYRYHIHQVLFTDDEAEKYGELTAQLVRNGFGHDDGVDYGLTERQKQLLRERRGLIEQADNKIEALKALLVIDASTLNHTLIYCSAKAVKPPHEHRQIELAREVLRELRITTHMYTSVETSQRDSGAFLKQFAEGELQTLLAMKVLDEGVDVPAAHRAFLLASSTVEREWIQRRGRILRSAPGKSIADLHDFVVIPPDPGDSGTVGLLRSELRRAEHFALSSDNYYDENGPAEIIQSIEGLL